MLLVENAVQRLFFTEAILEKSEEIVYKFLKTGKD